MRVFAIILVKFSIKMCLIDHLKVTTALRLVLLPSNHPFGKCPLFGQPQLISTHWGCEPDHCLSASQVLNNWHMSLTLSLEGWGIPGTIAIQHVAIIAFIAHHWFVTHGCKLSFTWNKKKSYVRYLKYIIISHHWEDCVACRTGQVYMWVIHRVSMCHQLGKYAWLHPQPENQAGIDMLFGIWNKELISVEKNQFYRI